jgi:hypothetical protein
MLLVKHRAQNMPTLYGITMKTEDYTKCTPSKPADIE